MPAGIKANVDGSAALQVGGTDFLTVTSGGNTTFTQAANLPNTFGFKNRIINGAMVIDQRNNGASVTPANAAYTIDRWFHQLSQASKISVQRSTTAPAGFINSALITSLSAYSVGVNDFFNIVQAVEGLNVADLGWGTANAQTITISFWVRSSLTGTFGGAVLNNDQSRAYPFTYTISAANTFEQKTVTIAGDTSGTWLTTNGIGLRLSFGLGAGSNYSAAAGAWASGVYISATGAVSVVGTNGATFYITGVQLEKGSTVTSFDYRPYTTELQLAQRYYYRNQGIGSQAFMNGVGGMFSTTAGRVSTAFPVFMRAAPSALEQSGTASDYQVLQGSGGTNLSSVPTFQDATINGALTNIAIASGGTVGSYAMIRSNTANAFLAWSAEL